MIVSRKKVYRGGLVAEGPKAALHSVDYRDYRE